METTTGSQSDTPLTEYAAGAVKAGMIVLPIVVRTRVLLLRDFQKFLPVDKNIKPLLSFRKPIVSNHSVTGHVSDRTCFRQNIDDSIYMYKKTESYLEQLV